MPWNFGSGLVGAAGAVSEIAGNKIKNNQALDLQKELMDLQTAKALALEDAKYSRDQMHKDAETAKDDDLIKSLPYERTIKNGVTYGNDANRSAIGGYDNNNDGVISDDEKTYANKAVSQDVKLTEAQAYEIARSKILQNDSKDKAKQLGLLDSIYKPNTKGQHVLADGGVLVSSDGSVLAENKKDSTSRMSPTEQRIDAINKAVGSGTISKDAGIKYANRVLGGDPSAFEEFIDASKTPEGAATYEAFKAAGKAPDQLSNSDLNHNQDIATAKQYMAKFTLDLKRGTWSDKETGEKVKPGSEMEKRLFDYKITAEKRTNEVLPTRGVRHTSSDSTPVNSKWGTIAKGN